MAESNVDPARTAEQLLALSERLGAGFRHATEHGAVGVDPTPRKAVARTGKTTLFRYLVDGEPASTPGTPLLVVYALVNRPYMMDLQPGRSVIASLLGHGVDTWLLDWGYPDASDQFHSLADYLFDDLDAMIDVVCRECGTDAVNLLGVCQGGVFSLCYTSAKPGRVANLVTLVTPVDFHTPDNLLSSWVRAIDVDALVDALGNVPGSLLNFSFLALKPFALGARKYLEMIDNADDAERLATFLRMEKWINDSPDQAGAAFREFARTFFVDNGLVNGTATIGEARIDLGRITHPLLNVIADRDHLVPPSASTPLARLTGSADYHEHHVDAGHIGLFVGSRTSSHVAATIAEWLAARKSAR